MALKLSEGRAKEVPKCHKSSYEGISYIPEMQMFYAFGLLYNIYRLKIDDVLENRHLKTFFLEGRCHLERGKNC